MYKNNLLTVSKGMCTQFKEAGEDLSPPTLTWVNNPTQLNSEDTIRGCLDSRNWVEVRKWEVSFLISAVHPNTEKENGKSSFPSLFSPLHNVFLTFRVLQLILWSCKSHL